MADAAVADAPAKPEPRSRCEFTTKQRNEIYKAFLKLWQILEFVQCGRTKDDPLCALHRSALAAVAPLVQVLAGGDQDTVLKMMRLHKDTHPGISMPNLMKAVAAALAESMNGHHR